MARAKLWVDTSDSEKMVLVRRGRDIAIRIGDRTLMSSDIHDSEDELGRIVAQTVAHVAKPRILIGGLGLGFTLRAALDALPPGARIDVAELMPQVAEWNRGTHGRHAGRPLDDRRTTLFVEDVTAVIARSKQVYDAISLDVDNGPKAISQASNERLYRRAGLVAMRRALRKGGVLSVWSAFPSRAFTREVAVVGDVKLVRTEPAFTGGPRYYIWLATKR